MPGLRPWPISYLWKVENGGGEFVGVSGWCNSDQTRGGGVVRYKGVAWGRAAMLPVQTIGNGWQEAAGSLRVSLQKYRGDERGSGRATDAYVLRLASFGALRRACWFGVVGGASVGCSQECLHEVRALRIARLGLLT